MYPGDMASFGDITLYALLLLSTWTGALAMVGAARRQASVVRAARLSSYATAVVATLSILVLAYSFAVSDFSLKYVHQYSDAAMPMFYKLTAVWGGQSGSMLVWAWLLAVMGAWSVHANRVRLKELVPWALVMLMVVLDFFCLMMLLAANPFDTFLVEIPTTGRGLNPLLQNFYMVIHPPSLYVGYVGLAIPFAFGLAATITGRISSAGPGLLRARDEAAADWFAAVRPFALGSWYFLTMGLVLGMLWAYEELGWGGYWAWDPVENAGLIPWLTGTAYLHTVMAQRRRQMFLLLNVALAVITFELTIFGTFLTRSGFIQSVHAFARSNIGWYFLGFMGLVAVGAVAIIVWRRKVFQGRGGLESLLSREAAFIGITLVLSLATLLVLVLTIFPTISSLFGDKVNIDAAVFNRWMAPIGLALLALFGVGPLLSWRKTDPATFQRLAVFPALAAGGLAGILLALGIREALALTVLALCAFSAAAVFQDVARSLLARWRSSNGDLAAVLLSQLRVENRRRHGAHMMHLGMVLMFVGFAGEAFKQDKQVILGRGERVNVGRYTLRFDGAEATRDEQKEMLTTSVSAYVGTRRIGTLRPARWVYYKHENQPTTEVAIQRSLREDLFVALGSYDSKLDKAAFKVIVNPLVNWIWIGFLLLSLGSGVNMIPGRARGKNKEQE